MTCTNLRHRSEYLRVSTAAAAPGRLSARQASAQARGELVARAREMMRANLGADLTLKQIADQLYVSCRQLQRAFTEAGSPGFRQEMCRLRMHAGAKLIERFPDHSIEEISRAVGYREHTQFSRTFRKTFGCTPRQWRSRCRRIAATD